MCVCVCVKVEVHESMKGEVRDREQGTWKDSGESFSLKCKN